MCMCIKCCHGYLYHSGNFLREDVKQLDVGGDSPSVSPVGVHGEAVDQRDDDVLYIDILLELGTRLEEGVESLEVELVGKHLR